MLTSITEISKHATSLAHGSALPGGLLAMKSPADAGSMGERKTSSIHHPDDMADHMKTLTSSQARFLDSDRRTGLFASIFGPALSIFAGSVVGAPWCWPDHLGPSPLRKVRDAGGTAGMARQVRVNDTHGPGNLALPGH
jgi:hypothetical protein